jgi:amino acid transporter
MLFFVIIIGPINLLVLAKKKKRMWLLWTVPVISLNTCFAVSAYSLFSEGWGGRARYLSYTILDERSHRAATIGVNAFYAPLTPGDGLRYAPETEVSVQTGRYSYSYDSTPNRSSDWTDDQHLETGWVTARTPAHFTIRRNETRRERMTITRGGDGSVSIVNGLGVAITNIKFADEKGMIYTGSNIAAGSSVILELTNERVSPRHGVTRQGFAGDWIAFVQRPLGAGDLPRPMTYVADLETCPFLEDGLKGVKQKKCEARVLGIMKGPGDED